MTTSEAPQLYPKTTIKVETESEYISDRATFLAMHARVLKDLYATEGGHGEKSKCINNKDLKDCEAAKLAVKETVLRAPFDTNDDFTGWVRYEPAAQACKDCENKCIAAIFWQGGEPTERIRLDFYKPVEPDMVIHINLPEGNADDNA